MELSWRDFLTVWGAGLSTFLAFARLLPNRPQFLIEPTEARSLTDFQIRVVNTAKRVVFIHDRFRIRLAGESKNIGLSTFNSRLAEIGKSRSLLLLIPAQGEQTIGVNTLGSDGKWLIIFTWNQGWFLPCGVPSLCYLSGARANKMKKALRG